MKGIWKWLHVHPTMNVDAGGWVFCGEKYIINEGWIQHGHIFYTVTRASISHATAANVLVPLKDVKAIWK